MARHRFQQTGAALVMGLIMLVLLTLLVLSAINSSTINLRIAGNRRVPLRSKPSNNSSVSMRTLPRPRGNRLLATTSTTTGRTTIRSPSRLRCANTQRGKSRAVRSIALMAQKLACIAGIRCGK